MSVPEAFSGFSAADLAEVSLPDGYMLTITADGVTVYRPEGDVLRYYGRAYAPLVIEGDAWEDSLDREEAIRDLDAMLKGGACG